MNSDFENQLQRQPLREVPPHWRARIIAAAQPKTAWWRELFWPCPQAWAVLGAAWVLILAVNFGTGKSHLPMAAATPRFSPQALAEFRRQQQLLSELIFPAEDADVEPPKAALPRRSELRKNFLFV